MAIVPTVTFVSQSADYGESVLAKSSMIGEMYLVPSDINLTTKNELDSLVTDGKATKVEVTQADTDTNIPTTNLSVGGYKVYAVSNEGKLSLPSERINYIPKGVKNVTGTSTQGINTISWTKDDSIGVDSYSILRRDVIGEDDDGSNVHAGETTVIVKNLSVETQIFKDNSGEPGKEYYYYVLSSSAKDAEGYSVGLYSPAIKVVDQPTPAMELNISSFKSDYLLGEEFDYEYLELTDEKGNQIEINKDDIQIIGFNSSEYIIDQEVTVKLNDWSETILVNILPVAPNLVIDDILDKIVGLDSTMEYRIAGTDNWIKYDENNLPDLSGKISILVRYSATNEKPYSHIEYCSFTNMSPFLLDANTKNGIPTNTLTYAWNMIDQLDESTFKSLNEKTLDKLFYKNEDILNVFGSKDIKITKVTWDNSGEKLKSIFTLAEPINMKEAVGVGFRLRGLEELDGWVGYEYVALYKATDSELFDLLVREIKSNELYSNGNTQAILLYMSTNRKLIHNYNNLFALEYIEEISSSIEELTDNGKLQELINKVNMLKNDGDQPALTKEALTDAIAAVKNVVVSKDGNDVEPAEKWTTLAAKTALETAVAEAQAVVADEDATQAEVDAAVGTLAETVSTYEAAQKDGTKVTTYDIEFTFTEAINADNVTIYYTENTENKTKTATIASKGEGHDITVKVSFTKDIVNALVTAGSFTFENTTGEAGNQVTKEYTANYTPGQDGAAGTWNLTLTL